MSDSLPRETLRVLRFIHAHHPATMKSCEARFGDCIRPRVIYLFDHGFIEHEEDKSRLAFGRDLGFTATHKGLNYLIDDHWLTLERLRDSILIPIFVSWFTAWLATLGK